MIPEATGRVTRLYVDQQICYITLDSPAASSPKDGQFSLRVGTPNYNSMYSLALAAAANRWQLTIRVEGQTPITPAMSPAFVVYVYVNWAVGS